MSKIFQSEKQTANDKRKLSQPSLIKSRGESEKEHEIKFLEDLFNKKLSQDYIDKLSVLLYNSKNKTDYSQKRNNLQKTIYKYDDNNELCLTLPKLRNKKENRNFINNNFNNFKGYTKTETGDYTNNKITNNPFHKQYSEENNILDESIKEILYDNEVKDKKEEDKGKILYEQLKTRYNMFTFDENDGNKKSKNLSKIRKKKQIPSEYKLIATPQQISQFDYNLGKSFTNGNLRYLTRQQKEKLAYIAELNLFLMPIDFFKYDDEKWRKYSLEKNKNINNIAIHELNDENRVKLNKMRDYVNKLNVDAFVADKEVNKTINSINDFLTKYGVDAVSRRDSKLSIRSIRYAAKSKNEKNKNEN